MEKNHTMELENLQPEKSWHICIIWENSMFLKDEILSGIKKKFALKGIFQITWSNKFGVENIQRFYGATLPDPIKKIETCGKGPFLVVVFLDNSPIYEKRGTSYGLKIVNANVHDFKMSFRKKIGIEFAIHGSNTEKETNHDLALLFGKNLNDFKNEFLNFEKNETVKISRNVSGYDGWSSIEEMFYILNATTNYVVLRNFEKFPETIITEDHKDIDILTDDLWQIPYIVNKKKSLVKISDKKIKMDFRYLGDNYYEKKWEKDILESKILYKKTFFVPNETDYFFSLIYHVLIHKDKITEEYKNSLNQLSKNLKFDINCFDENELREKLEIFLKQKDYKNTKSFSYKIFHNEYTRLVNVSIMIIKRNGFLSLIRAAKGKFYRKRLMSSGKI